MKVKKLVLVLLVALIFANIVFLPITYVNAIDDIFLSGDHFLAVGEEPTESINQTMLEGTSTTIYKTLLTIAICVSVLVGAVLGIQFMLGSVEGKVKVQEALVPYIVGCFVVFGAFTIWSIAINMGNNISQNGKTTEQVADEIMERYEDLEQGKVDLMKISIENLKRYYSENRIDESIRQNVEGDSRGGGGKTLDEAVEMMSKENQKIWRACKDRGLLDPKDGYTLKK